MMPDKNGITLAATLPNAEYTQSFDKNDVLVSNIRPYFKKIWRATFDGGCSNDVLVFRATTNNDPTFLYYVLADDNFFGYATQTSKGTKMPRGDKTAIMQYKVPDYDISTQRKIAAVLKSLDDKIELNNKINDNLEQQAQAIFKSWFVDFEPFCGKMPEEWEVGTLDKIVNFSNGYAFQSKELLSSPLDNSYHVFKQGHILRGGGFAPNATKSWFPMHKTQGLEKFVLKKGDVLMAMTDMKDNVAILGNTALMPYNNTYIVNQRVGLLRSNGYRNTSYAYVYYLTNSPDFLADLRSRANSGVQVNLSSAEIKASEVFIATDEINRKFNKIVIPMLDQIMETNTQNKKLAELRDSLLPKLMSGEIDVSEVKL